MTLALLLAKVVVSVARLGLIASVPLGYIADFIYLLTLDAIRRAWLRRPMIQS